MTNKKLKITQEWISISQFSDKLYDEMSIQIDIKKIRYWAINQGYLARDFHKITHDPLFVETDIGSEKGFRCKEMNLKNGKVQSSTFLNQCAIDLIMDQLHIINRSSQSEYPVLKKVVEQTMMSRNEFTNNIPILKTVDPLLMLKSTVGQNAEFREGQLEAINRILNNERLLVVQKTGWGKSIIYFICSKILRESGKGPTIIISPLLSLIRNQQQAARKLGLRIESINSTNPDDHADIIEKLGQNQSDILMISPEQLAIETRFSKIQKNISSLGLFVVDEAHCISDWGHDFRPDYRRIIDYINLLPQNIPILATTATANDRVVADISQQLGNVSVLRGPLTRESLKLKVLILKDEAERLAWLEINLPRIEGSGIVYCLTKRTTHRVTEYLRSKGIDAREYNADLTSERRTELEGLFDNNKIKCLVATVALGMGYDKPDISFVIHYQRPGNLITYYQQIGRAGRNLENAIVVLLSGQEDDEIQKYFIDSAFPTEDEMKTIVDTIENSDGLKKNEILKTVNIKDMRLEKCFTYLQVEKVLSRDSNGKYFRTLNKWSPNDQRSAQITARRYEELDQIKAFVTHDQCLMEFISKALDDPYSKPCGKCMNCDPDFQTNDALPISKIVAAQNFINHESITIENRKRWPYVIDGGYVIPEDKRFMTGRTLCIYGDSGYGKMIAEDKYKTGFVRDELIDASIKLIREWEEFPKDDSCICFIPSTKRPNFVKDFAYKVAEDLGMEVYNILVKRETGFSQKNFQNGAKQYDNAMKSFEIKHGIKLPTNILLIDDIVDSRWTLVAATIKLKEIGRHDVYPFTIANSNGKVENGDV
ncbi:MAG: ATP-dependent DNA helicase RecQ [Erysipelotrichaceae bacterium]|nr:MAG: ATP-dependent DNA helicase RecQ [Erysipelotrichaceae bacterium]